MPSADFFLPAFFFFFPGLQMELRASHIPGKGSTPEFHPQSLLCILFDRSCNRWFLRLFTKSQVMFKLELEDNLAGCAHVAKKETQRDNQVPSSGQASSSNVVVVWFKVTGRRRIHLPASCSITAMPHPQLLHESWVFLYYPKLLGHLHLLAMQSKLQFLTFRVPI